MKFINSSDNISENMLKGFFVGWPNPPSPSVHLKLLRESHKVVIALDEDREQVVGFITAISDNVLSAYIPLLEVLPEYQSKGIGRELVNKMINELKDIYMIDVCCDDNLISYYKNFGMSHTNGMILRNYKMQSGK